MELLSAVLGAGAVEKDQSADYQKQYQEYEKAVCSSLLFLPALQTHPAFLYLFPLIIWLSILSYVSFLLSSCFGHIL